MHGTWYRLLAARCCGCDAGLFTAGDGNIAGIDMEDGIDIVVVGLTDNRAGTLMGRLCC